MNGIKRPGAKELPSAKVLPGAKELPSAKEQPSAKVLPSEEEGTRKEGRAALKVGSVIIDGRLFLAPMAGFTDLPYRKLCRRLGASYAVGEMVASQEHLRSSRKSRERLELQDEPSPRAIQLLGSNAQDLAQTARYAVSRGAQIVDLNCGCPAKKVCSVACGSALLKNEVLIAHLLEAMVQAVDAPITLKFRTGWDREHINAVRVAKAAEQIGVGMLTLHGRTGDQGFRGYAEYDTIRQVREAVSIPVIANGDIDSGEKALAVLSQTGADGLMIGRAAIGNPWIFKEIQAALAGTSYAPPSSEEIIETIGSHLDAHFCFYGGKRGMMTIRKHLTWYFKRLDLCSDFLKKLYTSENPLTLERMLLNFLRAEEKLSIKTIKPEANETT